MLSQPSRPLRHCAQHGAVLIMALIFMVLLMILGAGAVDTVVLEERMAGNMRDKNLSFQAAEAALAAAERYLVATTTLPDSGGNYPLTSGRKPDGDPGRTAYWTGTGGFSWDSTHATPTAVALAGVPASAYYVIEELPPPTIGDSDSPVYRITVRATGGTAAALTMLQATYAR
jgi:type IV pilus assembly protein PilX